MRTRSASIVGALSLLLVLGGCAGRRYVPGPPLSKERPPQPTVNVWIIGDGQRGCMKDPKRPVATLYGQARDRLTWNVINTCTVNSRPVTVTITIEDVRVKHRLKITGPGKPPFTNPRPATVPPNTEMNPYAITADVFPTVPDDDYRGLNVYRYGITIKAENGPVNKDDPEILIDWP